MIYSPGKAFPGEITGLKTGNIPLPLPLPINRFLKLLFLIFNKRIRKNQ